MQCNAALPIQLGAGYARLDTAGWAATINRLYVSLRTLSRRLRLRIAGYRELGVGHGHYCKAN